MRYLSFSPPGETSIHLGILGKGDRVTDLVAVEDHPGDFQAFLETNPNRWQPNDQSTLSWQLDEIKIHTPLARPNTLRDFYAFEEHVATAHANRGRQMPKEWYEVPVFYFSNPHAVYGPDEDVPMPSYTEALDFELEVAAIIGKPGRDIKTEDALNHIFGFTIFNDWSARDVQRQEMKVGLGPAKGKDFASSFGPYIITPDELADRATDQSGVYDLEMIARINDKEYSRGNWNTLHYSFGDMIARASEAVLLQPGDIIGSGTVGTGCLLELTKGQGPWLQKGDVVELEIERLGVLRNVVS
ncbi:MAG: fumarylacetoacetate hydrolase family protein [Chloroflexi bacterium]|nr:MAG: fumarylacetoacetate hydrolase family protein [Chloroflexota bacterium]MBL1194006.1 fumarylacetoacetate hydrolase family protein [Chloroflexota bacterium]NOH11300.1 fumarylacetoacetate hydrolase family protein [Chloroflexota bacterium]